MTKLCDYTFIWNCLNYPAGVVPVTEATAEEETNYEDGFNDVITYWIR